MIHSNHKKVKLTPVKQNAMEISYKNTKQMQLENKIVK